MENVNGTFETLKERGYIYQVTDEEKIKELLNSSPQTFYFGIDPTADSLHIGHFFALTMVRRLQQMGHRPIILIGGATALVGDPTGKKDMRKILTSEQVDHNKKEIKELVKKFVNLEGENAAIILDNSDWINKFNYVEFMRYIGVYFNVNKMLATECYKNRLAEGGLTFLEMGYMLMQAYDFVHLSREYGCTIEVGGSDQWANMVAGVELSRKMDNADGENHAVETFTCPLLVKADGEKMGKTSNGTLWISREKTTVFDFYQMFINSYDEDVFRLLSFFSDYKMDEINSMCKNDIINAKKVMAYEVTKLVHGESEAKEAVRVSEELFKNKNNTENMPSIEIEYEIDTPLTDILVNSGLFQSKGEARRMIEQGGITLNQEKVNDISYIIKEKDIIDNYLIIQKGKKNFLKVIKK